MDHAASWPGCSVTLVQAEIAHRKETASCPPTSIAASSEIRSRPTHGSPPRLFVKTRVRIISGAEVGTDGWVPNFQIRRQ